MIIDEKIKNVVREKNNARVCFLQLLGLDKLYGEDKGDVDGYHDTIETFQKKMVLIRNWNFFSMLSFTNISNRSL